MLVNLLLLRGNIGREGTGCYPVRGHSNVQGQPSVGIAEKTKLISMEKLKALFDFHRPTEDGSHIVDAVKGRWPARSAPRSRLAVISCARSRSGGDGEGLENPGSDRDGFDQAQPQSSLLWQGGLDTSLPEPNGDGHAGERQSIRDDGGQLFAYFRLGKRTLASKHLKSELAIVSGIAKAALDPEPTLRGDGWTQDYSLVRDLIEATYPDDFRDYNARVF